MVRSKGEISLPGNWDITSMDVVDLPLEWLIPYARNPRKNAAAVATVAASLKEFGWRQPIVVDEAGVCSQAKRDRSRSG